jgi:hypothetical protein
MPLSALDHVVTTPDDEILHLLQLINQVPEAQLNEKVDPAFSLLRTMYDHDGPDFLTLRRLLGQASVRSGLNPSARCLLAGIISQRWDTFTLSGNLYLSGLRSANPELREKARKKLIGFIQPAHIPALIELLPTPGPNVLAYSVLQEATGQHLDPSMKTWRAWWIKGGSKVDLVGHLLDDTRTQLTTRGVHGFEQDRFWFLPNGVSDARVPYEKRPGREQTTISDWNNWVNTDVRRYADEWTAAKPIVERILHQPDPRVNKFFESLVSDPGMGDYASVVLAWRTSNDSLGAITSAYPTLPTVGRALARGSLGDKMALVDLLRMIESHQNDPPSYKIMDEGARILMGSVRTVGILPAEQAYALLCHTDFGFEVAMTPKEKKRAYKLAKSWLNANVKHVSLDHRRGYYTTTPSTL